MQQVKVTLNDTVDVSNFSKGISMMSGVDRVETIPVAETAGKTAHATSPDEARRKDLLKRLEQLSGIFADVKSVDTSDDPRLEYILGR